VAASSRWDHLADSVGEALARQVAPGSDQGEVFSFGLKLLGGFLLGLVMLVALAAPLGVLPHALAAAASGGLLRLFSGGAHSSTPLGCATTGAIVAAVIGLAARVAESLLSHRLYHLSLATLPWILSSCLMHAPAATPQKPLPPGRHRAFRLACLVMICTWSLFLVFRILFPPVIWFSSALGLSWQAFSLTPTGFAFARRVDGILPRREA
jgi:accessory gene regulator B